MGTAYTACRAWWHILPPSRWIGCRCRVSPAHRSWWLRSSPRFSSGPSIWLITRSPMKCLQYGYSGKSGMMPNNTLKIIAKSSSTIAMLVWRSVYNLVWSPDNPKVEIIRRCLQGGVAHQLTPEWLGAAMLQYTHGKHRAQHRFDRPVQSAAEIALRLDRINRVEKSNCRRIPSRRCSSQWSR